MWSFMYTEEIEQTVQSRIKTVNHIIRKLYPKIVIDLGKTIKGTVESHPLLKSIERPLNQVLDDCETCFHCIESLNTWFVKTLSYF